MKKKIIAAVALIVICISIMVSGTLAYFTSSEAYESTISTGNVEIAFSEDGENTASSLAKEYFVMPGSSVENKLLVYNIGPNSVWIRVRVDAYMLVNGQKQALDPSLVILDYDTEHWAKVGDYWYYTSALGGNKVDSPAEYTEPLFTSISFSLDMGNEYQGSTAQINVYAQAVQYRNNGNSYTQAKGWPDEEEQG